MIIETEKDTLGIMKKNLSIESTEKSSYGTGKRKSSIARVFVRTGNGTVIVNGKKIEDYFSQESTRDIALKALSEVRVINNFDLNITVRGGGMSGQAGAISLGLSRALSRLSTAFQLILRKLS